MLFVDVGNVKELNERLGHQAGDAALQAVARALAVTFRKRDVLARIGGTEFLVLAFHLDRGRAPPSTSRIRHHLAAPETTAVRRRRGRGLLRLDDAPGGDPRRSRTWWPAPTGPCSSPGTAARRPDGSVPAAGGLGPSAPPARTSPCPARAL